MLVPNSFAIGTISLKNTGPWVDSFFGRRKLRLVDRERIQVVLEEVACTGSTHILSIRLNK